MSNARKALHLKQVLGISKILEPCGTVIKALPKNYPLLMLAVEDAITYMVKTQSSEQWNI